MKVSAFEAEGASQERHEAILDAVEKALHAADACDALTSADQNEIDACEEALTQAMLSLDRAVRRAAGERPSWQSGSPDL